MKETAKRKKLEQKPRRPQRNVKGTFLEKEVAKNEAVGQQNAAADRGELSAFWMSLVFEKFWLLQRARQFAPRPAELPVRSQNKNDRIYEAL